MTFQPVVAGSGPVGWAFLQRTYDTQFEAFSRSHQFERDSEYFQSNIKNVTSASELVADRRLLDVALGAFGLQDDLNNRYFIQRILEDGTEADDALANRLADDRYKKLSQAFGFGPGEVANTTDLQKMADIAAMNRVQSFEVAVGETDETMRIALYAQRELASLASDSATEETKWFRLMGLPPLREMFETALGLPAAFASIPIDQQLENFRDRTRALTGNDTVAQFSDPDALSKLTKVYLARSQIDNFNSATSPASTALQLLRSAG